MSTTIAKQELSDRIKKVKALYDRAATPGEKSAAEARMNEMKSRYFSLFGVAWVEVPNNNFNDYWRNSAGANHGANRNSGQSKYSYGSGSSSWDANWQKEEPKKQEEKEPVSEYKFEFENQTIKSIFLNYAAKKLGLRAYKKKHMRKDNTFIECTRAQYIQLTFFLSKINAEYWATMAKFKEEMMKKEDL